MSRPQRPAGPETGVLRSHHIDAVAHHFLSTDDAVRSVQCALEMAEVLAKFNRTRLAKEQSPLAVGIGIHSGPLVAGYIGSSKALSYTVIGDVANTSSRLCSVALAVIMIVVSVILFSIVRRRTEY